MNKLSEEELERCQYPVKNTLPGALMESHPRVAPRQEQVDALLGDEFAVWKKFERLVSEEVVLHLNLASTTLPRFEETPAPDGLSFEHRLWQIPQKNCILLFAQCPPTVDFSHRFHP